MLAKGLLVVTVGRAFAGILTLVAFALTARFTPVADIGVLVAMLSVAGFLSLVADLGTSASISREAAASRLSITRSILRLNALTTTIMAFALAVGAGALALYSSSLWPLVIVGLAIALEKNVETSSRLFLVANKNFSFVGNALLRRSILISGTILGIFFDPTGHGALWGYSCGYLLSSIAGIVHVRLGIASRFIGHVEAVSIGEAWKVSKPFFIGNVSAGAKDLDTFLVTMLSGVSPGAQYGSAARIFAPLQLVPTSVASVMLPYITRNRSKAVKILLIMSGAALAMLVPILLVNIFLLDWLVELLLGAEYSSASSVLAIMLLGMPAFFMSSPLGATLQGMGRESTVARVGVTFALMTVTGVVIAGALSGAVAAAAIVQVFLYSKVITLLLLLVRGARR